MKLSAQAVCVEFKPALSDIFICAYISLKGGEEWMVKEKKGNEGDKGMVLGREMGELM